MYAILNIGYVKQKKEVIEVGIYKRKLKKGQRWYYRGMYLRQKYHSQAIYLTKHEARKVERSKI